MVKDLYIDKSKVHGHGVFTRKDFKKGYTIFFIKGRLVNWKVRNQDESLYGPDWIGINEELWIDPTGPAKYLNHSCKPNAGIKGKLKVVALKNIKAGEEITIDYSITEIDKLWYMKCDCGSKNCRKIIRSIQFLAPEIYNSYAPYIPSYFMKIYKSSNHDQ